MNSGSMAENLSAIGAVRNTTIVDQTAILALEIWKCLRDFQCEERLQRPENSWPEVGSIQVELSNFILTLHHLSEVIRSSKKKHSSTLTDLLGMALGAQNLVEDLNSIPGTDRTLLTNSPPSSLKAIFGASKYKLRFLRNRFASSADALNEAIVELPREKRSEKRDSRVESEDDKQKSIVAAWISPLDFSGTPRSTYREYQQGTGQWLSESEAFQSWLSERNPCLAIAGKPGSGKTVLASVIIHFLRSMLENKTAVVGIYLNRNSPNQTVEKILGTILQQLIMQRVSVSKNVMGFYNQHRETKDRPDIDALVEVLETELSTFYRAFIVLDALDGVEPAIRNQLLLILQSLGINQLVTSRAYPAIERELRGFTTLDLDASSNDVQRFVEAELSKDNRLARVLLNDAELRSMMSKHIQEKSQGMHVS